MSDQNDEREASGKAFAPMQIDQYTGDVATDFGRNLLAKERDAFLSGYSELAGFDRKLVDALWAQFVINTQLLRIVVDLLKGDTSAGASVGGKLVATIEAQSQSIISLVTRKAFETKE